MSVHVEWDNEERTTILWSFVGRWTWGEFDAAVEQTLAFVSAVDHKVDVIFDLRKGGFPPRDALWRFKDAAEITHPNMGQYVYVAPSMLTNFVKNVIQILNRAYGGFGNFRVPDIVFTKSLEEARTFLAQLRQQNIKAS